MPMIGFLNGQSPSTFSHLVAAFRRGLEEAGYVEDRNVRMEYQWAEGRIDALPALAAELIRRPVDLIVAAGGAHAVAKAATASIPIVFTTPGEPGRARQGGPCYKPQPAGRKCHRDKRLFHDTGSQAAGIAA
jgi:putative tryptophan/tyrosine transport system substrate-binding protein